jgi:photosystem II stability/assembly factor-like uncharacterized protein
VQGGFFQSRDAGAHWSPSNKGLFASTITGLAVDPRQSATVWVGTDSGGLSLSDDGGAHWRAVGPTPYPLVSQYG